MSGKGELEERGHFLFHTLGVLWGRESREFRMKSRLGGGRVTGGCEEGYPDHQVLAGHLILRYFP